jgi:predicted RNA-binding protein with PIN domain
MHWLIDGHNLIGQFPGLRLDDPHDEEKLMGYLRQYKARTRHQITVFFDSGGGHHSGKTLKQAGITVKFAPANKTADHLIAVQVRRVKNPQAVMVVSSDRAVQTAARLARVRSLSAAEFAGLLIQPGEVATEHGVDAGGQTEINLSPDEIEEWLDLFNRS